MDDVNQKEYNRTNMNVDDHDNSQSTDPEYVLRVNAKNNKCKNNVLRIMSFNRVMFYYYSRISMFVCGCVSLHYYGGRNECVCNIVVIHSPNV